MAEQAELAFVKNLVNTLGSQPVTFPNDFQQAPENTLKRVPVLQIQPENNEIAVQVDVPPPPEHKKEEVAPITTVQVTFKSLKPPFSITIPVSLADPISTVKNEIAAQPHAPPADAQRLLLKGKALADAKLLKEYNVKEGDTVNLMVKPGFQWDPTKPASPPEALSLAPPPVSEDSLSPTPPAGKKRGHGRIPSVVLSPTPTSPMQEVQDIPLVDEDGLTVSAEMPADTAIPQSTYQTTISRPEFWDKLVTFLRSEFTTNSDALVAFEDFLNASKGSLTASEIAKIRDHVGVIGMAGT
ncbi:hypothetical protein BV25DRAFT_1835190 [Artomyces pyxidatus]|uniref:Uncharacterized protein n=1 Tax=Artomyces pyxidatus TaxID=48021 RepID=A0ACB8TEE1_9AGAM|nr:hypothetical protein BV25DRAFT_1835190 [Artomyces pyxidatus]